MLLLFVPRLLCTILVMTRQGIIGEFLPKDTSRPLRWFVHIFSGRNAKKGDDAILIASLIKLGPTYVKLGQFLATRPDLIGFACARTLIKLQDKMPVFSQQESIEVVEEALGDKIECFFDSFGVPIAAASIAQVHVAQIIDEQGDICDIAVKVLRPGIEDRFTQDISVFRTVARMIDSGIPSARRLKLPSVIETLSRVIDLEMDLRMEAAAMSEMKDNTAEDEGFRVPYVDWGRSGKCVLTMEWIDGISLGDRQAIIDAGHDPVRLARIVVQSFLRHAMRDGFFHGDMHQGNLFVDASANLVAVDFGIMGRIGLKERFFLAEILLGFIQRDYKRVAEVHFEAGYVPQHHQLDSFAQALRAIGETLIGRSADGISMAKLLAQLFEVTEQFDMETRPELLLLQKSMLVVEGVARGLDPGFNMWVTAEPVVREWMETNLGAEGALQGMTGRLSVLNHFSSRAPELLDCLEKIIRHEADKASANSRSFRNTWSLSQIFIKFLYWGIVLALTVTILRFLFLAS